MALPTNDLAIFLRANTARILTLWEERVRNEIRSARHQEKVVLRNEIPQFLGYLADMLTGIGEQSSEQKAATTELSRKAAVKHGADRAALGYYALDEAIFEYRVLRRVLCEVLRETGVIGISEMEIIVEAIESSVNDMASQFSKSILDFQNIFVLTMVHDLRSPLHNASMAAQLLSRKDLPINFETIGRAEDMIQRSLKRLDRMVTDLLDANKLVSGGELPLQYGEMELTRVAREVIHEMNADQDITIRSSGEIRGLWSADGLRRVIENLLNNALKYRSPGTPVTLTFDQDQSVATFIVHNHGAPIPETEHEAIFQKFVQPGTAREKGWGLGLALVKGIVTAHGGSVKVDSRSGEGTTFTVCLPTR